MTVTKESANNNRPTSSHRQSSSSAGPNAPARIPVARQHSHSLSLGSHNAANRINRRKSSTSIHGVNMNALAAAAKEASLQDPSGVRPKSGTGLEGKSPALGASAFSAVHGGMGLSGSVPKSSSAVMDGPSLSSMASDKSLNKARARRASEGSRLIKGDRPKSQAGGELKCETCGKGYKHGSCLSKHLWEHTPEWSLTSKLLISKHQQVQLLEAASVLVTMNSDAPTSSESAVHESDISEESPAASGSSDMRDDEMSSRTSTPSYHEDHSSSRPTNFSRPKRQDSYSSALSRSYGSTSGTSYMASSAPNDGFMYQGTWHSRPSSSAYDEDQADLAAAAEGLVNCSLGTPQYRASHMDSDVPPVPPLPAKFLQQQKQQVGLGIQSVSNVRGSDRMDEDEDGVFGRMEQ